MHAFILSFVCGTLGLLWVPCPPGVMPAVAVGALVVAAFVPTRPRLLLAGFGIGILYAWAHAAYWLDQRLVAGEPALEGVVVGEIAGFPRTTDRLTRLVLDLHHPVAATGARSGSLIPGLFYGRVRLNCYDCSYTFAPGQTWRLAVRLRGVHGLANPGLFDYERWAFQQRFVATGSVRDDTRNAMLSVPAGVLPGQRLRIELADFIDQSLTGHDGAGVIKAVTLGERDGIDESQWSVFRRTGTSHLVAISGLHVGLVFGFVFSLTALASRLCPALLRFIPAQRLAAVTALPPTVFYAYLAGFSLPTQRAALMLAVFYAAYLLGRRVMGWHTVCVALGVVVWLDPFATLSQGFWLSFGAVGAIVFYLNRRRAANESIASSGTSTGFGRRATNVVRGWLAIQCAVSAVVVPMAGLFFGQLALASPFFNLLAIPWFSITVVPAALFGVLAWLVDLPEAGAVMLSTAAHAADAMQNLLARGATPAFVAIDSNPVDVVRCLLLMLLAIALFPRWRATPVAPVALAMLIGVDRHPPLPVGAFDITVLDVGQGLGIVVRTRARSLVFDTGIRYGDGYDMGRIVVNPHLAREGIDSLDVLVISHGDRDHAGGRAAVTAAHPRAHVFDSERGRRGLGFPCVDGVRWQADGVGFEFLSPPGISTRSHNNRSCVLRIFSQYGQALLPGDIEKDAERALTRRHGDRLASDVLIVPHHGSRTSSSPALLNAVDPAVAVVSRGLNNPFGHPHPDAVKRFDARETVLFDTAYDGAVRILVGPDGVSTRAHRHGPQPPWRSGARRRSSQSDRGVVAD